MSEIKYIERRLIFVDDLKQLCMDKKWYTMGDEQCFLQMLDKCKKSNITTEDILEIAKDIHVYTETSKLNFIEMCSDIANITKSFFEQIVIH